MCIKTKDNRGLISIWIDGTLHAHWLRRDYRAFQSWIDLEQNRFVAEIVLRDGALLTLEYDCFKTWKTVVDAIELEL